MFNQAERSLTNISNINKQSGECRKTYLKILSAYPSIGHIFKMRRVSIIITSLFLCNITLADQVSTAIGILGEVNGMGKVLGDQTDLTDSIDVLEGLSDLDAELTDEEPDRESELTQDLAELRRTLRESGATEQEITSEMSVFEKSKSSTSAKIRALRVLLKNGKRIQRLVGANDKKKQTLLQASLVQIEKEKLLLEIDRAKKEDAERLKEKVDHYGYLNNRTQSINQAFYNEALKQGNTKFKSFGKQGAFIFEESNLKGLASYIGLFVIAVGIIGVASGFFVTEGFWLLKSGTAFLFFVLIIPEVFAALRGLL